MYSDSLIVVIMDVLKSWAPDRRMRSSAELSLSLSAGQPRHSIGWPKKKKRKYRHTDDGDDDRTRRHCRIVSRSI